MIEFALRAALPLMLLLALQQLGSAGLIHGKAWLAPLLVERAWQQSLLQGGAPMRPWPWADTWPVARLVFPERNVQRLVLAGDSGSTLAFGPGHSPVSAVLGDSGESVIAGHRDTHFAFLRDVHAGERMFLQLSDGTQRHYRVAGIEVVDSSTRRLALDRSSEHPELRLITCYPFDAIAAGGPLRQSWT